MIGTLAPKGRMHVVGAVPEPIPVGAFDLIGAQRSVSGSPTGAPADMATMLDFAARHSIAPQVEHFPMSKVNDALAHLEAGKGRQLAEMGYIAFAADMFGAGKVTRDAKQAQAWYTEATSKPGLLASRSKAGLDVLRKQQGVDDKRLAAIGFCFGGTTVLQLAYSG